MTGTRPLNRITMLIAVKHIGRITLLALVGVAFTGSLACGKRKPPLPPKERVEQRAEIGGFQRGTEVILSWKMPARNAPDGSVLNIDRIDVYRLAEPVTSPQGLSEEEFAARSVQIGTIPVTDADFGLKTMTYRDSLQFAGQQARLRYAIRFVNKSGQKAAFSNYFLIEPAAKVASAPSGLSAVVSQESVRLAWAAPSVNVDGTTPANIIGYNIYRSESEKVPAVLLNKETVIDSFFADATFAFEKKYFYFVRTVSLGTGGESVESAESNIIQVETVDTFAPSAPSSITIAASPTTISLFFPANPEPDVVGYKIYRSTDREKPLTEWELMTPDMISVTTYQDSRVASGTTYYYYVTATDKYKNVSEPSSIVSETVP